MITIAQANADDARGHTSKVRPNADQILELASNIYDFRQSECGDTYVIDRETRVAEPLARRGSFRQRISNLARERFGLIPRGAALGEALETMLGITQQYPPVNVHLRIAATPYGIWLDMANDSGTIIKISNGTWRVCNAREWGVPIFRRTNLRPMVTPNKVDDWRVPMDDLRRLFRLPEPEFRLVLGWVVYGLTTEDRPFPILLLQAEQGSGKSTIEKNIVRLVSPDMDETGRLLPPNDDELGVQAYNHRVMVFDNISKIPPAKSDALCKVSTGGTFSKRKLYTDAEEVHFEALRPMVISTINLGTLPPDLNERIVRINLRRIEAGERRTETAVQNDWDNRFADMFGSALTLAAKIRQRIDAGFSTSDLPRMADYGKVLAAIDLEFGDGSIGLDAYRQQQASMAIENIADEPVWLALSLLEASFKAPFRGSSAELLRMLQGAFHGGLQTWKKPPESAADLTRAIDSIAPALRKAGWVVEYRTGTGRNSGSRIWTLQHQ